MPPLASPLASYKPPVYVGSVITPRGLRLLNRVKLPAQLIEVRVDELLAKGVTVDEIELALLKRAHPVLLTLRTREEGGAYTWRGSKREETFLHLLPFAELIDVELAETKAMRRVLQAAKKTGKSVILSAHSLDQPLSAAKMKALVASFAKHDIDCYKIAARVHDQDDIQQLASLLFHHQDHPWAVMGVGPLAAQTRLIFAVLGSRLAYGYLDSPAAPGQPSVAKLRSLLAPFQNAKPRSR